MLCGALGICGQMDIRDNDQLCGHFGDVASASLLETWIEDAEGRARFLFGRSMPAIDPLVKDNGAP